jgi:nitrogen-specific signal transduction histidine kinase
VNAIDALSEVPPEKRRLSIATAERPLGRVEVCVTDNGPGISADHMAHIFDPFFTTKEEGMGLGLSISRSVVQAHDGRIWAESSSAGAAFRFFIPAAARGTEATYVPKSTLADQNSLPTCRTSTASRATKCRWRAARMPRRPVPCSA